MKTISAETYLPILQALILDGKTVCLNISGSSMAPFLIHQRDSVRLQRPEHPPISGDIVLYQRENGQVYPAPYLQDKKRLLLSGRG